MAFNNPSSRTPVSYGSATKSLGYLARIVSQAFSGDNDEDESAMLLNKKKGAAENRFMVMTCCCCLAILVLVVTGFVAALRYMANPTIIPTHFKHDAGPSMPVRGRAAQHHRGRSSAIASRQRNTARALLNLDFGDVK
mmetsp:Transcript_64303/g.134158  ORF Transcript_64303/g.134158 Transcript_64303/m.134158 type:complete len:138 (-) Transcript_64303:101-514(-)|eukprot:CAMPEP_0181327434 /NCGR_PEP_ID=MMETSP1101-20121128/22100_1 /TAXON_ID=46948 /ORGANISM="Rhodomonas abbreviata, Strain Caron Lab Isolate" /LENGTH=137 /DNA_ID=CAMNT_0023436095 /DNA_START=102 /DNA_END=515 /DNA_ORIENTATION=-